MEIFLIKMLCFLLGDLYKILSGSHCLQRKDKEWEHSGKPDSMMVTMDSGVWLLYNLKQVIVIFWATVSF